MKSTNDDFYKELAAHNILRYEEGKPLYKYVTIETAIKILTDSTLKFSTAEELGDNDLDMALLEVNLTDEQVTTKKEKDFRKSLRENLKMTESEIEERVGSPFGRNFLDRINTDTYRHQILNSYKVIPKEFRFFCATISNNDKEMWDSKYTDFGFGLCIEYDLPRECKYYYTLMVNYDKEYKSFGMFNDPDLVDEIAMQKWYFTKKEEYTFEKEVRLFTHKPFRFLKVHKEHFTGLFYGKKTTQTDIDTIEKILKDVGYSFTGKRASY